VPQPCGVLHRPGQRREERVGDVIDEQAEGERGLAAAAQVPRRIVALVAELADGPLDPGRGFWLPPASRATSRMVGRMVTS
jgi:hypothetical protein